MDDRTALARDIYRDICAHRAASLGDPTTTEDFKRGLAKTAKKWADAFFDEMDGQASTRLDQSLKDGPLIG